MSIIDTLITDRTAEDASRLKQLSAIGWDNMTDDQKREWLYGRATETVFWQDGEPMQCRDGVIELYDVSGTNRGAYNYTDMNRVCEAAEYVYQRFNEFGYELPTYKRATPDGSRLDWEFEDIPTRSQLDQYLNNVKAERAVLKVLPTTPALPQSMSNLNYAGANAIEHVLIDVDALLTATSNVYIRAGMPWAVSGVGIYAVN